MIIADSARSRCPGISVAYLAFVLNLPDPKVSGDAHEAKIAPIKSLRGKAAKLAFVR